MTLQSKNKAMFLKLNPYFAGTSWSKEFGHSDCWSGDNCKCYMEDWCEGDCHTPFDIESDLCREVEKDLEELRKLFPEYDDF
jgi:hypothetical protein